MRRDRHRKARQSPPEALGLLIRAFGGRVVATKQLHGLGHGGGRDLGQGTAMVETFRLLEKHSIKLASQNYFGGSESHASPMSRAHQPLRRRLHGSSCAPPTERTSRENGPHGRGALRVVVSKRPCFVMNMIASIPGWLLRGYFGERAPLAMLMAHAGVDRNAWIWFTLKCSGRGSGTTSGGARCGRSSATPFLRPGVQEISTPRAR